MTMRATPFATIWSILFAGLALCTITVFTAIHQPWIGFTARLDGEHIVVDSIDKPDKGVQQGRIIQSIAGMPGEGRMVLVKQDLMEDPDQLETYQDIRQFFQRQDQLSQILKQSQINIEFANGSSTLLNTEPTRPLASLPVVFWVQMMVGLASFLIGGWVWGINRQNRTTFLLFIAGCCILFASFSAAIYSTRIIALPAPLFQILSDINHFGAMLFGIVILLLFSNYPRQLLPTPVQLTLIIMLAACWLCDLFKVFLPGPAYAIFVPVLLALLGIAILSWLQYRKAKNDPVSQAALRWFGLAIALGAGIPVLIVAMPSFLGVNSGFSQGYTFLFFLLIYVGVVQGVARYKLFELEGWAFRILFYLVGAFLLVLLDAVLIFATAIDQAPAFGISILAVAIFYLPLRDVLARRFLRRNTVDREKLFQHIVNISLAARNVDTAGVWRSLLQNIFAALDVKDIAPAFSLTVQQPEIQREGVMLVIPAVGYLPVVGLQYAAGGRRLFSSRDITLAQEVCAMLQYALQAKDAYEQGADQERNRIGRDLHDNIGAQLLSALQSSKQDYKDYMIGETLTDLRHIINNAMSGGQLLEELAIELRRETAERSEAAGLVLNWSSNDQHKINISARQVHALRSIIREAVSNAIRHAKATHLTVNIEAQQHHIKLQIADNGSGLAVTRLNTGYGLESMQQRLKAFKGNLDIQPNNPGLMLMIYMDYDPV